MATSKKEAKAGTKMNYADSAQGMTKTKGKRPSTKAPDTTRKGNRKAAGELAAGASDLTRAEDAKVVAKRVSALSEAVRAAGIEDITEGTELLAKSEDVAALSAIVGLMGVEDLERGMELARLSGEMGAVGNVVERLQMPVLAAFLSDRSAQLQGIAIDTIVRSAGSHALSQVIAVKGEQIGELGAQETAEGLTRLTASEDLAESSQELDTAGESLDARGVAEVKSALADANLTSELGNSGSEQASHSGSD